MFRAILVEEEVSYTSNNFNDLINKLYDYFIECYGTHYVYNIRNEKLKDCKSIGHTGEYFIHAHDKIVHCFIDGIN